MEAEIRLNDATSQVTPEIAGNYQKLGQSHETCHEMHKQKTLTTKIQVGTLIKNNELPMGPQIVNAA